MGIRRAPCGDLAARIGWVLVWGLCWAASLAVGPPEAQAQYVIGPGDVLHISVFGTREMDTDVNVLGDGKASVPFVGDIQAAGLTPAAFGENLQVQMARVVRNPLVSVSVKEVNSLQIRILGYVAKPGIYKVYGGIDVLQALAMAGGAGPSADLGETYVLRKGQKIKTNVERLMREADVSQELIVLPGDTLVVPAEKGLGNSIYVFGEVRRPGIQPMGKDLTVLQALINAGGFTTFASLRNISVIRGPYDKKEKIRVNVKQLLDDPEKGRDVPLQAGDVIYVPEGFF